MTGGDRGGVALELALGLGVLVLPVALLVATLPGFAERTAMARLAAQEAARVAALHADPRHGAEAGERTAGHVAANHGVPHDDLHTVVTVPTDAGGDPRRGGVVTARVTIAIPVPALPFAGADRLLRWTVEHRERIDDHRSLP